MIATRIIEEEEYTQILEMLDKVKDSPTRDKDRLIIAEKIETNLSLIGATAVEDKL